ncbi:aminotransferase class I/II-fold pyridoxal phosphate-dependent enzyme [Planctomycetota bacterium]
MSDFNLQVADRICRLPPYLFGQLNQMKYEKRTAGIDIIDLGMGNPSDPSPDFVVDKLCESVKDVRNQRYSASKGLFNLRREVTRLYQRQWNVELDPEQEVIACIGSKEGFSHMCLALLGPGDTAVVPNPSFPIHNYSVVLAGGNCISIPLSTDQAFIDRLRDVVENLYPKPKLLILNFPHNPTGAVVELDFFQEIVAYAHSKNLMIIQDLAYGYTTFDGYRAPSILQVDGAKDLAVEFTTMSKPYNMAGWRIGYCAGNAVMLDALAKIKGYYDYGIFQAVQIASIVALRHGDDFVREQSAVYQQRRDVLCDALGRVGWMVEKPKAGMFVWAAIPEEFAGMGSMDFCLKLMEDAEVAVAPGKGFGDLGEGYVRFAIVENEQRLKQAARQIGRSFRKWR